MPAATRERILARVAEYGRTRDLYRVALEWWPPTPTPTVELFTSAAGETGSELLARCESHGRWVEWLAHEWSRGERRNGMEMSDATGDVS
jgi:hypothetical protein